MLPGKVGAARKVLTLMKKVQDRERVGAEPIVKPSSVGPDEHKSRELLVEEDDVLKQKIRDDSEADTACGAGTSAASATPGKPKPVVPLNMDAYHPAYSTVIKSLLEKGEVYKEWDKFIEETAYHVISVGGMDDRGRYAEFGRYMHNKYPCIAHSACKDPWTYFNQKLSQKCRNIRWKWAARSKQSAETGAQTLKKRKTSLFATVHESGEMSLEEAKNVIVSEMNKPEGDRDLPKLFKAQKASFQERRGHIQSLPGAKIKEALDRYQILRKSRFIEKEFFLLYTQPTKTEIKQSWDLVISNLKKMLYGDSGEESGEDTLHLLLLLGEKLKFAAKTSKSVAPLITVTDSMNLNLSSKKEEAPRLIVIMNTDGSPSNCYVVCDRVSFDVGREIMTGFLHLLYIYYVFDLSYPKHYQSLGFVQSYILKDKRHAFFKSGNYLKFSKLYEENSNDPHGKTP